ncbi:MAG: DUF3473 domain-containing protein [Gammaproteobacteria bacterium]|nr:DUF3473 domain-containing protein [Gammaproteobacteria bacterium]
MKNAFTIDVEDYFQVQAFAGVVKRDTWDGYESRVQANTGRILDLLDSKNVKGTFFVLGWVAKRYPDIVREIAVRGHEVASHGMSHKLVYTQTEKEFLQETSDSKKIIEDIYQQPVLGYRAATYSITNKSLWALDILADLGFEYDSSIYPVHHDKYGIAKAPRMPHYIELKNNKRLIEFPIATVPVLNNNFPIGGGGYFRIFPYMISRFGLRRINNGENKPFVFYLHPWEVDPGQPRIKAGRLSMFRHYTNVKSCKSKLEKLLDDFTFTPMREVIGNLQALETVRY